MLKVVMERQILVTLIRLLKELSDQGKHYLLGPICQII